MPIIGVKKTHLDAQLDKVYNQEEFDELCFEYGLELDDVLTENSVETYRVELPANRYDLLCVEGLVRALRVFKQVDSVPTYKLVPAKSPLRIKVEAPTAQIRPFCVAAVLRNVTIDADAYNSFIDLQDKLHQNLCRKRSLVAIGTHDLDTLKPPFRYTALPPKQISFVALNESSPLSAEKMMEKFSTDSHLRHYLHIIQDSPVYPCIFDADDVLLSMPPIINGDHSKISTKTRNVLVECTATDLTKAKVTLDTIVTMFSVYCKGKFEVEPVEVESIDGTVTSYPTLAYRDEFVTVADVNARIGIDIKAEAMAKLLTKMCLQAEVIDGGKRLRVTIPPTRHDVLHACDIVEDVAIAYGYNNIVKTTPQMATSGYQQPVNKLTDQLRGEIASAGFTEALTFALCSEEDVSSKLRIKDGLSLAVKIGNPKTLEFQVARTKILPGLLKTLAHNRDMPLPLKLFELQDVVLKDATKDVGACNERHLCAVHYGKQPGFETIHGLMDRVMQLLGRSYEKGEYKIEACDDDMYFEGRRARILLRDDKDANKFHDIGSMGELHPEVITAFELNLPIAALEICIDLFV